MTEANQSAFLAWFIKQHGPREIGRLRDQSDHQLHDEIQRGEAAAAELDSRKQWDAQQQSALYAWQVKDKT
jgi:hypothetical protein